MCVVVSDGELVTQLSEVELFCYLYSAALTVCLDLDDTWMHISKLQVHLKQFKNDVSFSVFNGSKHLIYTVVITSKLILF